MKVVGYISSSKGSNVNKSLEIKIQQEQIEKYCQDHGFEVLAMYVDEPDDSSEFRKVSLEQLVQDSVNRQFERVIVLKFDRISYDKEFRANIYHELTKNSVEIYSLTDKTVLKDPFSSDIQAKIDTVLRKVKDIPSLPEVVTKVMELVSNPKSSAAELSRVISHDPGLTTRVLRLVNSAYYGFPKQISSVQQAIMILGFTTMRGLVLSTSIFKIFTSNDAKSGKTIDYKIFWKHSISVALCSRLIATNLGMSETGDAFSCGILHDIGKIVLDQYNHSEYVEVFQLLGESFSSQDFLDREEEIIGINHAEIGYKVADKWNLPANLSEAIRCHHNPMDAFANTRLVSVIYLANIFANILFQPYPIIEMSRFDPNVLEYLNINEDKLYALFNACKEEFDRGTELESFFE